MSFGGPPPTPQSPEPEYGRPPRPLRPHAPSGRTQPQLPARPLTAHPAGDHTGFPSLLAGRDAYAPPAPGAPAPAPAMPALPLPARRGRSAAVWVFGILGFAMLALIAYFAFFLGTGASIVGLVLALIPLVIVLTGVRMIDRWEPEPRSLVVFALLWGAVAAVGITLLVDLVFALLVGRRTDVFSAVVQAPVIEELAKGLGVLIVFLIGRRAFDGPVDGVVYGALVGAGFAFTENIQYFGTSLISGGVSEVAVTFILRGLVSPFAHAMFTAMTGFAIGLVARRGASAATALGAGALGLIGAIALHAYWNGSSLLGDFLPLYLSTQVPLFIGFIVGILALRREEARLTRLRLGDYAAAGWFTPQEIDMLATPAGRRTGLQWAAGLRGDRRDVMKQFIRDAAALAAVRQRAITGRDPLAAEDERALLVRTRDARARLLTY